MFGIVSCFLTFALLTFTSLAAEVDPQSYIEEVRYLASPELKGRATGSPELEKAAFYISQKFKSFGLVPADGKSFEQAFPVKLEAHIGPDNKMDFVEPEGQPQTLVEGRDFAPFQYSSSGKASGAVVFAGYGITAPEFHYDDYAGIDVKDKIVLVLRHEPQEPTRRVSSTARGYTPHATFSTKPEREDARRERG